MAVTTYGGTPRRDTLEFVKWSGPQVPPPLVKKVELLAPKFLLPFLLPGPPLPSHVDKKLWAPDPPILDKKFLTHLKPKLVTRKP